MNIAELFGPLGALAYAAMDKSEMAYLGRYLGDCFCHATSGGCYLH